MLDQIERRALSEDFELRCIEGQDSPSELVGYVMTWGSDSRKFGSGDWAFTEVVERDVVLNNLEGENDVKSFYNHDFGIPIARTANGSLKVEKDAKGLKVTIRPIDTQQTRDMFTAVQAGLVDGMSWVGRITRSVWEENEDRPDRRIIKEMDLISVDPVALPMYPDTTIAARSLEAFRSQEVTETPPPGNEQYWHRYRQMLTNTWA